MKFKSYKVTGEVGEEKIISGKIKKWQEEKL